MIVTGNLHYRSTTALVWPLCLPRRALPFRLLDRKARGIGLLLYDQQQVLAHHAPPKPRGAHDLRHTFAHRYLDEHPRDLVGLAHLLGHNSLDTTAIYTQPTAEALAERVDRLPLNAYAEERPS